MSAPIRNAEALGALEGAYRETLGELVRSQAVARLFRKDATLWKQDPVHQKLILSRLGWLDSPAWLQGVGSELRGFSAEIRGEGFTWVLLLGMGGSSLAPEVLGQVMRSAPGAPTLDILDSTDPAAVKSAETAHRLDRTFFLVSSKSGRTIETLSQYRYFRARLEELGVTDPGRRFAAVTDPGSPLTRIAREDGFRRVFLNPADIGGRFSALSYFGMAPAALLGLDLAALAARAAEARKECMVEDPAGNRALRLGAFLGAAARAGRDKLTLLTTPSMRPIGYWVEQLLAESTGKEGRGIVPVEGEPLGFARYYGPDRSYVSIVDPSEPHEDLDRLLGELRDGGAPWFGIEIRDRADLAAEFYRWETATAIACAALGVDPFDEPNVLESKENTMTILAGYEKTGEWPIGECRARDQGVEIYAAKDLWQMLAAGAPSHPSLEMILGRFFALKRPGDYLALLAYVERTAATEAAFRQMRLGLRDALEIPVLQGYGPRFLHSIGQLHKGGPSTGIYLELTVADGEDIRIPESHVSFGELKMAQALGDLAALDSRAKPTLRLHMTGGVESGLRTVAHATERALVALAQG